MLRTILKNRSSGLWAIALALLAFVTLLTLPVSAAPYHPGQKLHGRILHSRRHPVHHKRRHRKVKTAHKPTIHPVILLDKTMAPPPPATEPNTSHGIPPKGGN